MKKLISIWVILAMVLGGNTAFAATHESGQSDAIPSVLYGEPPGGGIERIACDANGRLEANATVSGGMTQTFDRQESSQDLSAAALNYTTSFASKTLVRQIMLTATGDITQTVSFSFNSTTGATYDTVLASEALVAEANYIYLPNADLVLESGDELTITCTNATSPAITVYVTVIGETLS